MICVLAGAGIVSSAVIKNSSANASRPVRGRRSIRAGALSIQLYTLRDRLANDLSGTLSALRQIGYERVEHAGFAGRGAAEFAAALRRADLRCTSGHTQLSQPFDGAAWQRSIDEALTIGQRYIVISTSAAICCSDGASPRQRWQAFAHDLNRAGDQACRYGLRVGFHNHHWDFARLPGSVTRGYDVVLAETDPRLVHMQLDIFWSWRGAQDPIELFRLHPGRFLQVHVKDMNQEARFTNVGSGLIDFTRLFAYTEQAGILEFIVERDDAGVEALETARAAYAYLRGLRF